MGTCILLPVYIENMNIVFIRTVSQETTIYIVKKQTWHSVRPETSQTALLFIIGNNYCAAPM